MMVLSHLFLGLRKVYVVFWAALAFLLAGILIVFEIFGPWSDDEESVSAWSTFGTQAPMWFLFTIGIMLATVSLPVAVAHGITRRQFCRGAAVFGVGSSVLSGLLVMLGFGVEYGVYRATGLLAELDQPYPVPTLAQGLLTILAGFGYLLNGWVVGLCFYRLSVWRAIASLPLTVGPLVVGLQLPMVAGLRGNPVVPALVVAGMAVAGYLLARDVPLRARKA